MTNEQVMRSVYLKMSDDSKLRQLAHELSVTRQDLIMAAITSRIAEWEKNPNLVLTDLGNINKRNPSS